MPAIRKIRIVNFRFNDGAKLIPDEIFCTENAEGKPIDTLLNLDNGVFSLSARKQKCRTAISAIISRKALTTLSF